MSFAKPGKPLVWTGQFVFGYPKQLAGSPLTPGPISDGGASWMTNGSFLVFRRLRQDVRAFRDFLTEKSTELSTAHGHTYTPRQLGAKIVGRWEDGTPVTISPEVNDRNIADDNFQVNNFAYRGGTEETKVINSMGTTQLITGSQEDNNGLRCPFFAHIRKVNPRDQDTDQGNADATLTFQMLRRGIPYGVPFIEGDNEEADRGLLFLAYQTSFIDQFRILNNLWMNNPSAPEKSNTGHDMLVGQNPPSESRFCKIPKEGVPNTQLETLARWVIPTGGAFLFSPSISFFRNL